MGGVVAVAFHPVSMLVVVSCCLVLGSLAPMLLQPLMGWQRAFRYSGWCSVLVLLAAIGVRL